MNKKQRREAARAEAASQPQAETQVLTPITPKLAPLPKLPKAPRKPKPLHACSCGCGGTTTGRFCPGHDGRLKGWAIRVERGVIALADIPDGERQAVERHLQERAGKSSVAA